MSFVPLHQAHQHEIHECQWCRRRPISSHRFQSGDCLIGMILFLKIINMHNLYHYHSDLFKLKRYKCDVGEDWLQNTTPRMDGEDGQTNECVLNRPKSEYNNGDTWLEIRGKFMLPCFLICYRDSHVVANICYSHKFMVLLI